MTAVLAGMQVPAQEDKSALTRLLGRQARRAVLRAISFVCASVTLGLAAVPRAQAQDQEPPTVVLIKNAAHPAHSPDGRTLAFARRGADDRYDVWLRDLGASGVDRSGSERCLTCEVWEFRKTHVYKPRWHASGERLVFLVQSIPLRLGFDAADLATPRRGFHADLYLMRLDGKDFWKLTRSEEQGKAVLDPSFSYDGDQLIWAQRRASKPEPWGEWELMSATVTTRRGGAKVTGVKRLRPLSGRVLRIGSEFTPDDSGVLFSARRETDDASDIYRVALERGAQPVALTSTPKESDDLARLSPDGTEIVWSSNRGIFPRSLPRVLEAARLRDLWVMAPDGSGQRRLTWRNQDGEAHVGANSFAPGGRALVFHVIEPEPGGEGLQENLYQLSWPVLRAPVRDP